MASLAVGRWLDIPFLLQSLSDLFLSKFLLFRPVFVRPFWLAVFGDELRRLHVARLPIEIENLFFRAQEIFRVPMAFEAPRHAERLGVDKPPACD